MSETIEPSEYAILYDLLQDQIESTKIWMNDYPDKPEHDDYERGEFLKKLEDLAEKLEELMD